MEFLFVNQIASIEAMIVFACMLIIAWVFWYDGFLYARQVFSVLFPKRSTPLSHSSVTEVPLTIPWVSPFSELLKEKTSEESQSQFTTIDGVVLDNPVLYPEEWPAQEILGASLLEVLTTENIVADNIELEQASSIADDTVYIGNSIDEKIDIMSSATLDIASENPPMDMPSDGGIEWNIEEEDQKSPLEEGKKNQEIMKENITEISKKWRYEEKLDTGSHLKWQRKSHIKPEKREKLVEIINNIKTLIARGQIDDARALIVSGLSIEKANRELNLLMASLYERDHAFAKAEFILKDIAIENPDDIEVLTHLATDLAMQRKYDVSYELYKKILSLGGETEECLYTLTHLASEMSLSEDIILYARSYLKQYPHNPEILWIYTQWLISLWHRREAVETLIKLKNLTPYNQEIADLIQKLVTEEELAGNFGGEK